jgi:hypothetical protein
MDTATFVSSGQKATAWQPEHPDNSTTAKHALDQMPRSHVRVLHAQLS